MSLLDDMKVVSRVSTDMFDVELNMLINAAKADMERVGISTDRIDDEHDPLVKMAVASYVKARFGFDEPSAAMFERTYRQCVADMLNSSDYNTAALDD